MGQPKPRVPKLRRNVGAKRADGTRSPDQAFIEFRGHRYYLGNAGSPEADRKYALFRAAFAENPSTAPLAIGASVPDDLTVNELLLAYWEHAELHYRKNGRPTSEIANLKPTIGMLAEEFGESIAKEFGPRKLKALRQKMIDRRDENDSRRCWSRNTINQRCGQIRRIFRWAVENELVPPSVLQSLEAVQGLERSRTEARETEPVRPVDAATIEATLLHLPPVVADMVRFHRLTGCRPTEACIVRPGDVDRTGEVWVYRPAHHKTEHHGRERIIFIGPRAQKVLLPYLDRPSAMYCFSPIESEQKRLAALHATRKTPIHHGNRPGGRNGRQPAQRHTLGVFGDCYTKDSYNRAVRRGIERANALRKSESTQHALFGGEVKLLDRWRPNQLRHTRATELLAQFGIDATRSVLGHSDVTTTQIYAERDLAAAAALMKEVG